MEATTQSEASRETRWVFRVGGVSAIAGAIIGLVGNLLHPQTAGPGDPEQTARVVADSRIWVPLHLALLVAFLLMLGGLVAIGASISGGPAGALARFGFAAAIVGTTAGVIDVTLDGFAAKHLAEWWMSAPPKARATAILPFWSEDAVNFALLSPLNLVFAGFTFVLYGLAAALDGAYPRWLGWTVAVAGAGGAISGGIQASVGEPTGITEALGSPRPRSSPCGCWSWGSCCSAGSGNRSTPTPSPDDQATPDEELPGRGGRPRAALAARHRSRRNQRSPAMTNEAANRVASTRAPRSSPAAREAVTHRRLQTNGIDMHVAEAGSGPLVVLLHGFPELWYSWRHQLPVLAAAGYHAVAPDLRGYGGSDASAADEGYAPSNMAADVVGLLHALGAEEAVLVGHDWGANIAWACAELFGERVAGLVALSVPYRPRPPAPPREVLRQFVPGGAPASPYPLGVTEAELEADPRRSMRRFMYALSGEAPPDLVPRLFNERAPSGRVLDSMPEPDELPGWLGDSDLNEYARAYAQTGFRGPLGVYRNQDRDWHEHPEIGTAGVRQPALFVGGRRDPAVLFGKLEPMEAAVPNLRRIVLLPNCGHWTQQERPGDVNDELLDFLRREQRS